MQSTTTAQLNVFANLTNNPVVRTAKNNQPYTLFTVAFNPSEGERRFAKCFIWGSKQRFAKQLTKGARVHVIGSISERTPNNGDAVTFVTLAYFKKYEKAEKAPA